MSNQSENKDLILEEWKDWKKKWEKNESDIDGNKFVFVFVFVCVWIIIEEKDRYAIWWI